MDWVFSSLFYLQGEGEREMGAAVERADRGRVMDWKGFFKTFPTA